MNSSAAPHPLVTSLQSQVNLLQNQVQQLINTINSGSGSGSMASAQTYPTSLIVPFSYIGTITLAAAAGSNTVIQMASDSTFELVRFLGLSSADVPTNYWNNNFTVQLTDQSTGRLLSAAPIPQCLFVTNAYQFGNDEKYPIMWPAQAIINLAFVNLTNAQLTVNFVLKGYKIFATTAAGG